MRSVNYLLAAALVLGVSGTTMAQTPPPPPTPAPPVAPATAVGVIKSHWTTAGFVGSNWGRTDTDLNRENERSVNYGGQVAYLYRGVVGGEFLAEFTPNFGVDTILLPKRQVNSYMGNIIGVLPLGTDGQFQPYASGGWGSIQLRFENNALLPSGNQILGGGTLLSNRSTGGGNIGGGIMVFAGRVGIRGDLRHYNASTTSVLSGTIADQFSEGLLSGVKFWRSNIGIAFQW